MRAIQQFSTGVLAEIIRRQPSSPARTNVAWQLAVGPALARATTVTLENGVLTVRSADERWTREVGRASDVVLKRLQNILGPEAVRAVQIER
ncbi:MAG TPA: DciA family protein [Vicinamibacterales bacterium]|nr:DciA family protein [Vicinamibacterales bacterium]